MKTFCVSLLLVLLSVSLSFSRESQSEFPALKGPYLGQPPPGPVSEVFAGGILNELSMIHGRITFSPDGGEVYWSCNAAPVQSRWYMSQDTNGVWSRPQASFLSVGDSENALSFSPDGKRMYYHSRRPDEGRGGSNDQDIWYRERTEEGWGDPVNLGAPVNNVDLDDWAPTVAGDGTMYFCRVASRRHHGSDDREGQAAGANDIYFSRLIEGEYTEPVRLGPEVNSESHDIEPAVSPDNTYIVFISNRPGGYSAMMNLYVSFRVEAGDWTEAQCLSDKFEVDNIWFPSLTSDGKYLCFCGGFPTSGGYTNSDYYWVDTKAIEGLRPKSPE